jgi:hypothetical protein
VFFGARSDPELKAAQAQKSELSRGEFREFLTEVILMRVPARSMSNQGSVHYVNYSKFHVTRARAHIMDSQPIGYTPLSRVRVSQKIT